MLSLGEGTKQVNLQVKRELYKLVRKEDSGIFERIKPSCYPPLVRLIWYTVFDPSRSLDERQEHHKAIRNIFEVYRSNPPRAVITATTPTHKFGQVYREMNDMLPMIKEERQLVVPIMVDGILPGAFVYDHLKKRNMLHGLVFLGYTRKPTEENYYKPGEVYATKWDIETLRKHSQSSILVVDDAIDNRTTLTAIAKFMNNLGIKNFNFICLRDMSSDQRPAAIKVTA